jgi:hypothetical protein
MHNIQSCDCLSVGMSRVGGGVLENTFQENLEFPTSFIVDIARDAFYSSATCEAADVGFGDALNVVTQNSAVALGSPRTTSLGTFSVSFA